MTTVRDHSTLAWVTAAIDELLERARNDLEEFIEGAGAPALMSGCAGTLHQVHGTLRMLEVYGAAMLVEEMEQLALALGEEGFARADEAGESLMLALVRLPDYLEKLQAGGPDIPLVLLPLINDLRTIRGAPLLAETALFFPSLQGAPLPDQVSGQPGPEMPEVARALRPAFHKAQLNWYRGLQPEQGLDQLQAVIGRYLAAARTAPVYRLFQAAHALVGGLGERSIETGATVKQLLARLDRQVKQIIDGGEVGVDEDSLSELTKNMLYYLAQAESSRPEVLAVQQAYRLDQALPDEEMLSAVREQLSAPSQEMLETVFGAIQEDLLKIKDSLDLFIRNREQRLDDLVALEGPMRTVADTLGMIGQGSLRIRLLEEVEQLRQAAASGEVPGEEVLMGMAGGILFVESALRSTGGATSSSVGDPNLINPTMREIRAEMTRVKEAIMVFVAEPEILESIRDVPAWFYNIAGAFCILSLPGPAEVLDELSEFLKDRVLTSGLVPEPGILESFADAVSAIEYYAESLVEGRGDVAREQILATAQAALARMRVEPSVAEGGPAEAAVEPVAAPGLDIEPQPALVSEAPETADDSGVVDQEILEIFLEEAREELDSIGTSYPRWRANPEDEEALGVLRRSFHTLKGSGRLVGASTIGEFSWSIENMLNRVIDRTIEAGSDVFDILDSAIELFPALVDAQERGEQPAVDVAPLAERAFALAHHGYQVESVSPSTAPTSAPPSEAPASEPAAEVAMAVEVPGDAEPEIGFEAEPGAVPEPEVEAAPEQPGTAAETPDTGESLEPDWVPEPVPEAEEPGSASPVGSISLAAEPIEGPEIDEEILEIFLEEAREELASIQEYLPRWLDRPEDVESLRTVRRSFHTLKGSGRLVGAVGIGEFAWSLENLLNQVLEAKVNASSQLAELLQAAADILPQLIDMQEAGTSSVGFAQPLVDRAFALAAGELPTAPLEAPAVGPVPGPLMEAEPEAELQIELGAEPEVAAASEVEPETESAAGMEPEVELTSEGGVEPESELETELVTEGSGEQMPDASVEPEPEAVAETEAASPETVAAEQELVAEADVTELRYGIDPALFEIFEPESREHLATLAGFVDACHSGEDRCELSAQVARAFHTLRGSAHMAQVHPMGEISSAMEAFVNELNAARIAPNDSVAELVNTAHDLLGQVLDGIADPAVPIPDIDSFVARINGLKLEMLASPPAEPLEEIPLEVGYFEVGGDSDLVEIFLEEAKDLIEALDNSLRDWRGSPRDNGIIEDLQRTLHTLKGGARLAGIMPLGDLSHAFETLLTGVVAGDVDPSPAVIDLAQDTTDWLVNQIDEVARSNRVASAESLVAMLESARSGDLAEPEQSAAAGSQEIPEDADAFMAQVDAAVTGKEKGASQRRQEQIRVRADLLDLLVNNAGEASIYRARLDQQNNSLGFHLAELEQTVERLRSQLRHLEIETEAQILFRFERDREAGDVHEDFDPLEMDRFSTMQQLSRSLMETVNDLSNIKDVMDDLNRGMETLLLQQSRVSTDLQDGLLRTRMVPFSQVVPRLHRLVRQTGKSLNKLAELEVHGAEEELDRNILERMLAPLEHILRNAISHGIEDRVARRTAAKPEAGRISIYVGREGTDVVLNVADDGAGMNLERIRERALERGLMNRGAALSDDDVMQFVLAPGFSTASEVTQVAGRGVGMDVVASGIKQLGGTLEMDSQSGRGTSFTIRLPLTLAISEALLAKTGDEIYAIPYATIEGVVRIPRADLLEYYRDNTHLYSYAGHEYQVRYLGGMLGTGTASLAEGMRWFPVLLVRSGDHRVAIQVDELLGNRQIVVKTVGPQLSSIQWITGATILGDGRVALILDLNAMIRMDAAKTIGVGPVPVEETSAADAGVTVMVVDDSITVRKVTTRLLERHNMHVVSAKDGMDAVTKLQERIPDVMLLDIEMPRMDGFEVVRHMRNTEELKKVPVIMITSRSGEKHRQRAMELGVQRYLGKPYQETELLDNIYSVLSELHS